ncbi:hypothetical protein [Epibacterium ulvae]|uniref:hypothetical protein n=1 Tax=Epibacterium ulvae TaxID=1156985 RepID=UPI00249233DF|nr:hypothetical protein [Epibacterium ulvae]
MSRKFRFSKSDLYLIDRIPYRFVASHAKFATFRRDDGSEVTEQFSWEQLDQIVGGPSWDCIRKTVNQADASPVPDPYRSVWNESKKQQILIFTRCFFVCALAKLHSEETVKLTPCSVKENMGLIRLEAERNRAAFNNEFGRKKYFSSKPGSIAHAPSVGSILSWHRKYVGSGGEIASLKDNRGRSKGLALNQESYTFILGQLRSNLNQQRHSFSDVVDQTLRALKHENEQRRSEGKPLLDTRGRSTLFNWLGHFSPIELDALRHGLQYAKRKYSAVAKTDRATRPGEVFQVDEWEIDARSIIINGPIAEGLDQQTLDALPRGRRWMYIVIDVATRYIVGLVIAKSQNQDSAVRALHMATVDKNELATAAGAQSEWRGFAFETLESDTGSAFRANHTTRAVNQAFATYCFPQLGEPQLRGVIERVFGTIAMRAMPYVPGRTFSNPKERGDYPTEELAVLTDDQLALIFIRYIVDVYHNTPHAGLFAETPADALCRTEATVGLPPRLSPSVQRRAFGLEFSREVTRHGIRFLAISYNSPELQTLRQNSGTSEVTCYLNLQDLNAISVWTGSKWIEVQTSIEVFSGVTLSEWIAATKLLRKKYYAQAELKSQVVEDALNYARSKGQEPLDLKRTLPQHPTAEDLERLNSNLYWGLSVTDDTLDSLEDLNRSSDGVGYVIATKNDPPTDEPLAPSTPHTNKPEDLEDDDSEWWQKGGRND